MNLDIQLIKAYRKGDLSQLKSLIEKGANVHERNEYALCSVAEHGHLELVKYLVEDRGADVHADDDRALRFAAHGGHLQIVKYLVAEGANVHAYNDHALRSAAYKGHLDIFKFLIDKGADIHAQNDQALRLADLQIDFLEYLNYLKTYKLSQFTKKHIDKQKLRYVFQQYELPFEIQQLISSYVLKKDRTDQSNKNPFHTSRQARPEVGSKGPSPNTI